nr:RNA-directed DNA polymerase, eukaryota, reverse transcriptase zinc-binding domain protein [Tanacetum cinerariifolium]
MGVHVDGDMVNRAAGKLGCLVLETPFSYLGSIVGGYVSQKQTWNDIPERVKKRLCKWKMQTLSIGGRLTKKATWVNWKKVLLSKDRGGLGVSSLYAMKRGLLFKWIWRFFTQGNTLWARVIKAIHGADGRIGAILSVGISSCWTTITHEMNSLSNKGIDLMEYMHIKEMETLRFSRRISGVKRVFLKIGFRANPRGGCELDQFKKVEELVRLVSLALISDRWIWELENTGEFSVASVRRMIDDKCCRCWIAKRDGLNTCPSK